MYYDDEPTAGGGCVPASLIVAVAILALGGLFYFGINRAASNLNPFNGVSIPNPLAPAPTTVTVDRPAIIRQMQALNRLETYTYLTDQAITAEQGGNAFYNFFRGDKLLLIARGEVVAGFDLTKLKPQDVVVSADGQNATVTLPPAEILVSRLDNENTRVYDRQTGIFTKGNPGLEAEARRVAEQKIVEAACDAGILKQAATNGQRNIEGLVKSFGIKNVTVNAYEGSCAMPGGTQPAASPAPSP